MPFVIYYSLVNISSVITAFLAIFLKGVQKKLIVGSDAQLASVGQGDLVFAL